jgi:hypothetical protein
MSDGDERQTEEIAKSFEKVLNSHGYGFQYSVLKQAETLVQDRKSPWYPIVPEFPVEVQGNGTRIDFILHHQTNNLYMLAECKRVNPALSNWCFAKASFLPRSDNGQTIFIETVNQAENPGGNCVSSTVKFDHSINIYHIGLEVKNKTDGEPNGSGHGEIEQAATQILRGLNGMIDFIADNSRLFGQVNSIGLLPVIFTTAQLWVSDVDLGSADLSNGNIKMPTTNLKKVPWLYYQYNQSPGLKHILESGVETHDLQKSIYQEYVRTIAIVSSSGISDFLCQGMFVY